MQEWKDGHEGVERWDGETLLPRHELERFGRPDEDEFSESDYGAKEVKKSVKGRIWILLATVSTLTARGLVRGSFPYPLYLLFLLQVAAYLLVVVVIIVTRLVHWRNAKRGAKSKFWRYTILQALIVGVRLLISACFSAFAMLFAANALMLYNNLTILSMLPILTYVADSIILRLLHVLRLSPRENVSMPWKTLWIVVLIPLCIAPALYTDYRLSLSGLLCALLSFALYSLAKAVIKIGPMIDPGRPTWESPFYVYLLVGIPFLIFTGKAAVKYENIVAADNVLKSWSGLQWLWNMGPAVILQLLFTNSVNSAYPYSSKDLACGALEDSSPEGTAAVRATLHTAFFIAIIGVFGDEHNLLDWYQILLFMVIYIVSVGPRHIAYYPPRFFNFIARLLRRKTSSLQPEPWQFIIIVFSTTLVFAVLMSCITMFWVDTLAFDRDAKTWFLTKQNTLDTQYLPPKVRSLDIVIAHSRGDSKESIADLLSTYATVGGIAGFRPRVIVYTKDNRLGAGDVDTVRGSFEGPLSIQSLNNSGGPTATFLHHILYAWETLSQQTLFLSTQASNTDPELAVQRLREYFMPAAFPIADAGPKTTFMNLGPMTVCHCGSCTDETGWEDSFHLVPSMWGAANPGTKKCESVLLTRGNRFLASSSRIRGLKRDTWQLLYDALVKDDISNSWAHEKRKFPIPLPHEPLIGRWSRGGRIVVPTGATMGNATGSSTEMQSVDILPGVYGLSDTLERPWLGFTVERLWGVLLQCSTPEIAWKCPSLERSWRVGWDKPDCTCVD
ncbi:hypothetical protein BJ875DRAFT_542325 [Amylocarpus encephaloides]|uniref:Uncharacterized protein n=1 Tax=Amylocarpus encephaloides TaxID=45428 RepID=A0A9P7YKG4_9HELO|nr:hypothetical protein BJ875DRAFT_542325 [Amylocarpus encephaloides]